MSFVLKHLQRYMSCILVRHMGVLAFVAVTLFFPSIGLAQNKSLYKKNLSKEDSIAIGAASILADTGRMIPGLKDLKGYNTPGYCLALTYSLERAIWRSGERDTMKYGESDSLPTEVREKGAECIAEMSPEDVLEMELYNLLEVSARVGDTARMRATVEKYTSLSDVDLELRLLFVQDAAGMAVNVSRPRQFRFVADMLSVLKRYGTQSIAQTDSVFRMLFIDPTFRFDTASMVQARAEWRSYLSSFSKDELKEFNIDLRKMVYEDSLMLATFKQEPDWLEQVKRFVSVVWEDHPMGQIILGDIRPSYIGRSPGAMEIVRAFPADASPIPEKGKVTIYYASQDLSGDTQLRRPFAVLRRLYERYHDQGLEIVIVTAIQGHMWRSPPLEPRQEAQLHAWYFRAYHELPFKVLVNSRVFSKKHDGRLIRHRTLWERFVEDGALGNRGYLVGKDGTIQSVDLAHYSNEEEAAAYIERELKK